MKSTLPAGASTLPAGSSQSANNVQAESSQSIPVFTVLIAGAGHLEELDDICRVNRWNIMRVDTCNAALSALKNGVIPIVICNKQLPDGTWQDILSSAPEQPRKPYIIVTDRVADDHLWAEVLNVGGYNVLAQPFDHNEVTWVVDCAWQNWLSHTQKKLVRTDAAI